MDLPVESILTPRYFDEALVFLADDPELLPVAGGTDVVVQIRAGRFGARRLMDISMVTPNAISVSRETLAIGAGATMDTIARSEAVHRFCPGLAAAAAKVGAWPIQCRATIGGNLGNASPAADTAPPLLAADASIVAASSRGERTIPIADLFTGPGTTVLSADELIRQVLIPPPAPRSVGRFAKLGWRREQIISVVSIATQISRDDEGVVRKAAIALGSVAPRPTRAPGAEGSITGRRLDASTIADAVKAVQADIAPIDDVRSPAWYRRVAAAVLLQRLLQESNDG